MATNQNIPYKLLMELHRNYLPTHAELSKWKNKPESKSIFWELTDELRRYLAEILKEENEVSGLRFYLCEYKNGHTPPGTSDEDYGRKLTIGMVTTKKVGDKHVDQTGEEEKVMFAQGGHNHGKICPPEICP